MLVITRPPRYETDVSLSETGRAILESDLSDDQLNGIGQAVCSQLVDVYGESGPPRSQTGAIILEPPVFGFIREAAEILSEHDMSALMEGFIQVRQDLSEVPA